MDDFLSFMYIYKRVTETHKRVSAYGSICWIQEQMKANYDDRNQNSSFRGQISGKGREACFWGHGMSYILIGVM